MIPAPVLIFAIGNESRGDDALGPLLLRQLDDRLKETGNTEDFELIEDFQLQIEHAMDMKGRRLVLFIDAGMDTPAPYSFFVRKRAKRQYCTATRLPRMPCSRCISSSIRPPRQTVSCYV